MKRYSNMVKNRNLKHIFIYQRWLVGKLFTYPALLAVPLHYQSLECCWQCLTRSVQSPWQPPGPFLPSSPPIPLHCIWIIWCGNYFFLKNNFMSFRRNEKKLNWKKKNVLHNYLQDIRNGKRFQIFLKHIVFIFKSSLIFRKGLKMWLFHCEFNDLP